jgi:purine catabolism regulator
MTQQLNHDIHLGDVIRIALPIDTTLHTADPDDVLRLVNWVSLLTKPDDLEDQVEAGDLVICPNTLQQQLDSAGMSQMIEQIAGLDAVALVLKHAPDEKSAEFAHTLRIPLLIIPPETTIRDLHKNISSLLLDRQTRISERGMQLYRELSETSRDGGGLDKMALMMGQLTGKIIVIQDKRLDIHAIARPTGSLPIEDETLFAALQESENLPAVLRNRKAAAKATRSYWQQLLFPHHNVARLLSPIISGDRARGYLSIIGAAGELSLLDTVAVEQGAAACALEMAKAKAISEAKKSLRGNFLEGILAGTIARAEADRLASRLDHDTTLPHAILTFRGQSKNIASLRRIETTLNWLLSSHVRPVLVHIYGDDHLCVFHALRTPEEIGTAHQLARRLRSQLKADFPDMLLAAGVSGPVITLSRWPETHEQAVQAMEVGLRLRTDDLVDYHSLGVYRLLSKLDNIPTVHEFSLEVIGPLVTYDAEHRSNLVQTVREYFDHHGNVSQTAEALFIHRNTLLYRLERIQELTGHDLNQSDQRLALHLALKLWQLHPEQALDR